MGGRAARNGKLDLRRERIELSSVVAAAVETARPIIDAKNHELTVSLPANPVAMDADPIRLSQALTNLLTNAAKYSEPGGLIVLTARRVKSQVVIGVKDSGDLIPGHGGLRCRGGPRSAATTATPNRNRSSAPVAVRPRTW